MGRPVRGWCSGLAVAAHVRTHDVGKQRQHLAVPGVAAGLGLGVDQVSVEGYVEHTVVSRHGPNVADDMLVVAE